ncbi:hypothetical protein ACX6XY_24550 [Streptomyces sp. O3]
MTLCLGVGMLGGWGISEALQGHRLAFEDTDPAMVSEAKGDPWPTRGDLKDDKELLRAATRAFLARSGAAKDFDARARSNTLRPRGKPEVLFAGTVADERPTVLLRGEISGRGVLFRYEDRGGESSGKVRELSTYTGYATKSAPLVLNPSGRGTGSRPRKDLRLLLPASLPKVSVAGFDGESYAWRPVTVKDGVTEPLRTYDPSFTSRIGTQGQSIGACDHSGLLLRGTTNPASKHSREAFYVVRSGDPHAIHVKSTESEPLDAPQIRTLARSLLCQRGAVHQARKNMRLDRFDEDAGDPIAAVSWEQLWNGKLPGRDQRQELVRIEMTTMTRWSLEALALVGVDELRYLDYLQYPELADHDDKRDNGYGTCVAWDSGVVVAGGDNTARIEVTDLKTGEKITEDGASLAARRDGPGERGPLTATVTKEWRFKGRDKSSIRAIRCYTAPDTPTF